MDPRRSPQWILQCLSLVSAGGSCLITMTEHERGAAGLPILSAAVNVVASVFFISMLGLTGAAIATTIALIVWNVAMAFFISRHLRLLPGVLGMFGSTLRRSLGSRLEPARP